MTTVAEIGNALPSAPYARLRGLRSVAPSVALLIGTLVAYALARGIVLKIADGQPYACLVFEFFSFTAAGLLARVRYVDIPPLLRVLVRGISVVLLIQIAFDAFYIFYGGAGDLPSPYGEFFRLSPVIGLLAAFLALRFPGFAIPTVIYYIAFRHQFNKATGIAVSETDYGSLLDIGLFVAIGATLVVLASRSKPSARLREAIAEAETRKDAASLIWACAVGAHLGNYLISGWTKIKVGGTDPFFWLMHNPTQTSILIGLERGDNPLASWPWLVQRVWDAMIMGGPVINFFVLGVQIAAPLALSHRRVLMAFTLMFDFFHLAVYSTLGALFHFWIILNVLIYLSARRISDGALTLPMKATGLAAVLFGHFLFYTSHLGWLDGAKLSSPHFVAETTDGNFVPLPSVYFGLLSYSIAQTAMYIPDDNFQMRLGGNTYNPDDWRDSQSCGPKLQHHQDDGVALDTISEQVRVTDAAMRHHPLVKSENLYYLYPHHMVANPYLYKKFNRLMIKDIARYHYMVDSVCLSLRDGHLIRDVRKHTNYPIDVQR